MINENYEAEVEENWEKNWKDILLKEDGTINTEQLKKELWNFSFILREVPKVYDHITGGILFKPTYFACTVIRAADERTDTLIEDALNEEKEKNS